jgi:hypothetical protein
MPDLLLILLAMLSLVAMGMCIEGAKKAAIGLGVLAPVLLSWLLVAHDRRMVEENTFEVNTVKSDGLIVQFVVFNGKVETLDKFVSTKHVRRRMKAEWSTGICFLAPPAPTYEPILAEDGME